jgi:hypothetical protein
MSRYGGIAIAKWSGWDWISYGCLGLAALGLAVGAWGKENPEIYSNLPTLFASPRWAAVPAILFALATVIFIARLLLPGAPSLQAIEPSVAAPSVLAESPRYVKEFYFVVSPGPGGGAMIAFTPVDYLDRLRIYVEYSNSQSIASSPTAEWTSSHKMSLADLRDLTKGQQKVVPLMYERHVADQRPNYWWGDSNQKGENRQFVGRRSKAQIYFVGPDNKEQKFKFVVFRTTHDLLGSPLDGGPSLMILDESEINLSLDWPQDQRP